MRALRRVRRSGASNGLVTHVTEGAVLERLSLPGFGAFLDGVPASRVLALWEGGEHVVHGTVAAVVRVHLDH